MNKEVHILFLMDFWYGGNMKLKECTVFCLVMALLLLSAGTATADTAIQFGMTADGGSDELKKTSCATNYWFLGGPVVNGLSFEGVKRTDQGAYIIPANKKIISICIPHFGFLHGVDTLDTVGVKKVGPEFTIPPGDEFLEDLEIITAKKYFNKDVTYLGNDGSINFGVSDGIDDCYVVLCDISDAEPLSTGLYIFVIKGWIDVEGEEEWRAAGVLVNIYVPEKSSSKK
ncbi:hypothetical protein ACSAZK_17125 [Methanosarcina sp. Mfa9]|uniref:hypothetical protein n=1 Tax=Methanosarcina sp. Mfa9 TaxID=3439063 RepID=UPI003F86DF4A